MTEHRPREIQLTSKQLVFVFMSTLLVAVVVFLLGVWVGRGIDVGSMAATGDVTDVSTQKPAPSDPGTSPSASGGSSKYDYPGMLQGSGGAVGEQARPPVTVPAPPPAAQDPGPAPNQPAPPPDPPVKAPPDDAEPWVIQVGAFSNKAGADKVAGDLRGKGYPVTVTPGPTFKVWVGPYPKRAAADQVAVRLRKEVRELSVIRSR